MTPPALDFGYAAADTLARQLADPQVLAVFGFGDAAPAHDDPRWLRRRRQAGERFSGDTLQGGNP
jgi:chorismate lyase/3-hydroxybenzoate synthase